MASDKYYINFSDSTHCRICSEENNNGVNIFNEKFDTMWLSELINLYLPITVDCESRYPQTICPGCHIQLQATISFFDLLIAGQLKLRTFLNKNLEEEDSGFIPEYSKTTKNGPLFERSHELSVLAVGKRGRGRPPKKKILIPYNSDPMFNRNHESTTVKRGRGRPRKNNTVTPSIENNVVTAHTELSSDSTRAGGDQQSIDLAENVVPMNSETASNNAENVNKLEDKSTGAYESLLEDSHSKSVLNVIENGVCLLDSLFPSPKPNEKVNPLMVPEVLEKRERKLSTRLEGTINGQELEDTYLKEGVVTKKMKPYQDSTNKRPELIGYIRAEKARMGLCEVVVNSLSDSASVQRSAMLFRCEVCDSTFNQEAKLYKHNAEEHCTDVTSAEESQHTPLIDQAIQAVDAIVSDDNVMEDLLSNSTVCIICDKKFTSAASCKGHMLSRHGIANTSQAEGKYDCSCGKSFSHLSSLAYHKESTHSSGRVYACSKCDKTFKHKQLLNRHQTVHSDVRSFKCELCDATFKTKANLISHAICHSNEKKFNCELCGTSFAYRTSYTLHIRSHAGDKPYECADCGKKFTQKGNLKEHIRTHTGEKPFKCEVCLKQFTTSSQFSLHFKRHIGYKPWKCVYCNKAFLHKNTWLCHLRRHKGEKPYSCKSCDKRFSEVWALKKHLRLHTGERPYSCPTCCRTFSDCSNLTKHKKMHLMNELKQQELIKRATEDETLKLVENTQQDKCSTDEMWTILNRDSTNDVNITNRGDQQIIYLTYENPVTNNPRLSEQLIINKTDINELAKKNGIAESREEAADDELNGIFVPAMQVLDDRGDQLKFTSNGTLFQVTTMDGQPLQVALGEEQPFPLAITSGGDSVIQQLRPLTANIPIVHDLPDHIAVASDGLQFIPDDQHFKLITELNTAALNLPGEYLEMV